MDGLRERLAALEHAAGVAPDSVQKLGGPPFDPAEWAMSEARNACVLSGQCFDAAGAGAPSALSGDAGVLSPVDGSGSSPDPAAKHDADECVVAEHCDGRTTPSSTRWKRLIGTLEERDRRER